MEALLDFRKCHHALASSEYSAFICKYVNNIAELCGLERYILGKHSIQCRVLHNYSVVITAIR